MSPAKFRGGCASPMTAAIIIIGNEILSGKIKDTNSYYLARQLRSLGVDARRIMVIPDKVSVIAKEVYKASKAYDYVFTAGGIGPTHDDLTIDGIAKGFGLKTVKNDRIVEIIKARCGSREPDSSTMKMAYLPEGAQIIKQEGMKFPVMVLKNVFIFPGIPSFLRQKFSLIKDRFRSRPFRLKKIYVNEEECFITSLLEEVVAESPDVAIGSYPNVQSPDYKVIVTLESIDRKSLLKAYKLLLKKLPPEVVVR